MRARQQTWQKWPRWVLLCQQAAVMVRLRVEMEAVVLVVALRQELPPSSQQLPQGAAWVYGPSQP